MGWESQPSLAAQTQCWKGSYKSRWRVQNTAQDQWREDQDRAKSRKDLFASMLITKGTHRVRHVILLLALEAGTLLGGNHF